MAQLAALKTPIPDVLNPVHMEYIKAKSADNGGDTLAQHTWDVLHKLGNQYQLRSWLAARASDERLWHRMYWACFLHDFGKAAQGFQERLQDKAPENEFSRGQHRHEVLSLAFVNWLFPPGHTDRLPVICAIASHHKDADDIFAKYGAGSRNSDQQRRITFLVEQLTSQVIADLWLWLQRYGAMWQSACGLPPTPLPAFEQHPINPQAIEIALDELSAATDVLDGVSLYESVYYRALILTADHAASAGAAAFPELKLDAAAVSRAAAGQTPRAHQRAAERAGAGSALLVAPTGSGKTEAALYWLAAQQGHRPAARVFYTLPYQASMNAMAERLSAKLFGTRLQDSQRITLLHSRATLKYFQDMMDAEGGADPRAAGRAARERNNLARLCYYPIQVFSPYQMLKVGFGIKGYEPLLLDYTDALFVFDEIHAYDPQRLALIVTLMGWLAKHFGARFLVMTATLPPLVRQVLVEALPGCQMIEAGDEEFARSRRHRVYLLNGTVDDYLDEVLCRARAGENVLVCCNQVGRAQAVYDRLKDQDVPILLLHGRFNGEDRQAKEKELMAWVGVHPRGNQHGCIVVATQVVEVSLDVDFDRLYSDPAPLEALLQRFGRVNRGRGDSPPLCPVYVCRAPADEKGAKPYDTPHVQEALRVLEERGDGWEIDEAQVTKLLETVYNHPQIRSDWEDKYRQKAREFASVLNELTPYQSNKRSDTDFDKMFDGVQVIPSVRLNEYLACFEKDGGGYLKASKYLVNVTMGQFHQMKNAGKCRGKPREHVFAEVVDVAYDAEYGLRLDLLKQEDDAE